MEMVVPEEPGTIGYGPLILIEARQARAVSYVIFDRFLIGTKKSRATKGKPMTSTTRYSRRKDWAEQRAQVWTWMYRHTRMSLPEIAAVTNCPTHTTIHAAIRRLEKKEQP